MRIQSLVLSLRKDIKLSKMSERKRGWQKKSEHRVRGASPTLSYSYEHLYNRVREESGYQLA